jgi:membrane-associated phospholipid phosphatase
MSAMDLEAPASVDDRTTIPIAALRCTTIALFACFGALAIFVLLDPAPTGIEAAVDRLLRAPQGSAAFALARAVSVIGSAGVVAALTVVLAIIAWMFVRPRSIAVLCVAAPALAGVGEIVMKAAVGRTRPVTSSLTGESGFSFPSGHTSGAAALAVIGLVVGLMLCSGWRLRRGLVGFAFLYAGAVGVSRVVLGAHYALDVVGGWLFGSAVALTALLVTVRVSSDRGPSGDARHRLGPPRDTSFSHP